jgi:hypothetical protein
MMSQTTTEESLMVPDFSDFIVPDRSGILMVTAAAIAIGTIDGARYRIHVATKTFPNNSSKLGISK